MRAVQSRTIATLLPVPEGPSVEKAERITGVNWLIILPEELQVAIASVLAERELCTLGCSCHASETLVSSHATVLWRSALTRAGIAMHPSLQAGGAFASKVDFRALQRRLGTPLACGRQMLEVQGLTAVCGNPGEQHAWWRCEAVGIAVGKMKVMVRVRAWGYPASDDEWRALEDLRPHSDHVEHRWREEIGAGSLIEVSWAQSGHPAARWEAIVTRRDNHQKKVWLGVFYENFAGEWNEVIRNDSKRLMPRRERCRLAQRDVWLESTQAQREAWFFRVNEVEAIS